MNFDQATSYSSMSQRLRPYLLEDEELLWCGRPYASVSYRPPLAATVFMLFWFGFAVFWTVTASIGGGFFGLFGLPFLGFGGYALYSLLRGAKKKYANTVYAVTNRRAVILTEGKRGAVVHEFLFANQASLSITATRGDSGTIAFAPNVLHISTPRAKYRYSTEELFEVSSTTFEMIDQVHTVYRLISERIVQAEKG